MVRSNCFLICIIAIFLLPAPSIMLICVFEVNEIFMSGFKLDENDQKYHKTPISIS